MKLKTWLFAGVAAMSLTSAPVQAAQIVLVDLGGVTGSQAERGFKVAADYWSRRLTNDVTINLGVGFSSLDPGVIGSTGSTRADFAISTWKNQVNLTKSGSTIDQSVVLPTLVNGGIFGLTAGVDANGNNDANIIGLLTPADTAARTLFANTALIKAVGGTLANPGGLDGSVRFSSDFGFDFNPVNGISANTFDFIGVAIHEIGHALGFVSGVDIIDIVSLPNGPFGGQLGYDINDTSIFSALDMFRYGEIRTLDFRPGGDKYFSIDGGATALFGNSLSTGAFNGDENQASHWKDASGANSCGPQLGIMDPTFCFGQTGVVTRLDLAAFDAMGWNLDVDALTYQDITTGKILQDYVAAQVPEPSTWAMMIAGIGFVGGAMRRKRTVPKKALAT